ncbi:MAG: DUF2142 domain-containing protein [Actinobacteria bacterium]|nr:DUF2142 domain-containing protein [Actinomycetota bacterium]
MNASSTAHPGASSADAAPSPAGPLAGGPPALVWLLTALHAVLLVFHGVLVPTWRAPDELDHVDLAVAVAEDGDYPAYDQRIVDPGIARSVPLVRLGEGSRHLRRGEAMPRGDRPTRKELRESSPEPDVDPASTKRVNHMAQHPPAYYLYLAGTSVVTDALAPGTGLGSYDREVATMRLLSLILVIPLPLLAWAAARAVDASEPAAVAAAVIPLGIPQLTHIGAGVNNDALLLLLMGILTLMAVRFATGHVDGGGIVLAGALTGLALLTKAFAFVVPVWLVMAVAGGVHRSRRWVPVIGGYLAVALVTGGWWWVMNLVRHGSISPSIEYARLERTGAGVEHDLSGWLADWVPNMSERFWGSFGWVEVPLPVAWTTVATAVVVVGVIAALVGKHRGIRGEVAVALLAPTLLLGVFVFLSGFRLYQLSTVPAMVQGRYLFGGLVGLSVLVAVGLSRLLGRRAALLPALLLLAAAAMQLRAMTTLLDAFWGEQGSGVAEGLAAAGAWSPWPPGVLVALTAAGAVTVVATGVGALRFAGIGSRQDVG